MHVVDLVLLYLHPIRSIKPSFLFWLPLQRQQTRGLVEVGGVSWSRFPSSATCRHSRRASCCLTTWWMAWRSAARRKAAVQLAATCAITRPWWEECQEEAALVTAGVESSLPPSPCYWKSAAWCPSIAWSKTTSPKRWEISMGVGRQCVCLLVCTCMWVCLQKGRAEARRVTVKTRKRKRSEASTYRLELEEKDKQTKTSTPNYKALISFKWWIIDYKDFNCQLTIWPITIGWDVVIPPLLQTEVYGNCEAS